MKFICVVGTPANAVNAKTQNAALMLCKELNSPGKSLRDAGKSTRENVASKLDDVYNKP